MTTQTPPATSRAPSAPARPAAPRPKRRPSLQVPLMLVPGFIVLLVFFGLPVVDLVDKSLSHWSGIGSPRFTGLDNYVRLFNDTNTLDALLRSLLLGFATAAGVGAVATVLAALVSGGLRGSRFYRIVWFAPAIAPPSAVAVFWSLSVQPQSGVVNAILGALGLGDTHAWLAQADTAMYVIIAVAIWMGVGFAFLVILGAMEEVPVSTYEAAALDGASVIRVFFSITLPLIRPVLSMILLLYVIWAFNGFTLVWGMTTGGPGNATVILPVQVYKEAFEFGRFGFAAAVSVVGGIILLVVGILGQWFGSRKAADE